MANHELISVVRGLNYKVSRVDLRNDLIKGVPSNRNGVMDLAICAYGAFKSKKFAIQRTDLEEIPTLFLEGGLSGVQSNYGNDIYRDLVNRINQFSNVHIVLWYSEVYLFKKILSDLRYFEHFIDDTFITDPIIKL